MKIIIPLLSIFFISQNCLGSIPKDAMALKNHTGRPSSTIILDSQSNLICIDHTEELANELGAKQCAPEDLMISSSISNQGLQVAYLSHLAALGAGCFGGAIGSIIYNKDGQNEESLEANEAGAFILGFSGVLAAKQAIAGSTAVDPSGHVLATSTGVIACAFTTQKIIKFFWN